MAFGHLILSVLFFLWLGAEPSPVNPASLIRRQRLGGLDEGWSLCNGRLLLFPPCLLPHQPLLVCVSLASSAPFLLHAFRSLGCSSQSLLPTQADLAPSALGEERRGVWVTTPPTTW